MKPECAYKYPEDAGGGCLVSKEAHRRNDHHDYFSHRFVQPPTTIVDPRVDKLLKDIEKAGEMWGGQRSRIAKIEERLDGQLSSIRAIEDRQEGVDEDLQNHEDRLGRLDEVPGTNYTRYGVKRVVECFNQVTLGWETCLTTEQERTEYCSRFKRTVVVVA